MAIMTGPGSLIRYELQTRVVVVVQYVPQGSDDSQCPAPFTREHVVAENKEQIAPESLAGVVQKVVKKEEA